MKSIWSESVENARKNRDSLEGDLETEVLVVGGGMAGVLIAHRLKQAGVGCIVAEARQLGSGATQNTTAKITAQHGLIYANIIKRSGFEAAEMYLDANRRAIGDFCALAAEFPCDFEETTSFVYSVDSRRKLEREASAYQKLGLAAEIKDAPQLPFRTAGALAMERQAQFNPMLLLTQLAEGLEIFENTVVLEICGSEAVTKNGKICAKHIVLATHFPMVSVPGLYFMKLYQHRSYVIALEGAGKIDGMYVDERPDGHSFRGYRDLLLLGGGDHKTGKKGGGYAELRGLALSAYADSSERFSWATQDCMSLDGLPYIGRHRAATPNLYVATGFNKWGMSGSMLASRVICDLITTGKSELERIFSPARSMLTPQLVKNLGSAAAGLLSFGAPRCTHMGCKLHWNSVEKTWDCTCHGSRFDECGRVLDNPAKRDAKVRTKNAEGIT